MTTRRRSLRSKDEPFADPKSHSLYVQNENEENKFDYTYIDSHTRKPKQHKEREKRNIHMKQKTDKNKKINKDSDSENEEINENNNFGIFSFKKRLNFVFFSFYKYVCVLKTIILQFLTYFLPKTDKSKKSKNIEKSDKNNEKTDKTTKKSKFRPTRLFQDEDGVVSTKRFVCGLIFLFLLTGGLFKIVTTSYDILFSGFNRIKLNDTRKIERLINSGEPWLVQCDRSRTPVVIYSKILQRSASTLKKYVNLGIMDCASRTSKGRSILKHLRLPYQTEAFVIANRQPASVIHVSAMQNDDSLVEFVKNAIVPKLATVNQIADFEKCSMSERCLLLSKRGPMKDFFVENVRNLFSEARGVNGVIINTNNFKVKLDEELLSTRKLNSTVVDAVCLIKLETTNSDGLRTMIGGFFNGDIRNPSQFKSFLKDCNEAKWESDNLVKLSARPTIYNRSFIKPTVSPPKAQNTKQETTVDDNIEDEELDEEILL